jgi:membrane protein DedA with SNARE-associated domain
MITFIVYIIVMLLNCVTWYHIGKAQGKYEILEKMLEDEEHRID